jgi:tRNA A-37 threonylcarbamoyl transferase component Bud32
MTVDIERQAIPSESIKITMVNIEVDGAVLALRDGMEPEWYQPLLLEALAAKVAQGEDVSAWEVERITRPKQLWLYMRNGRADTPTHGWKLHVSASLLSAQPILERILPILLSEDATFKLCASSAALLFLNQGFGGISQVGKFITIYPNSDEQAVRLAVALDAATRGMRAPSVLSDRPLSPGSLVHYRYGTFRKQHMHTKLGLIVSAFEGPDGNLVKDHRVHFYVPPDWAQDPFEAAGVAAPPKRPVRIVGGRYFILAPYREAARGVIYDAIDIEVPRQCIIKHARRNAAITIDGRDARDRLRNEAEVLKRLAPNPAFPEFYGLFEENGEPYLAMERIEGITLERKVRHLTVEHGFVPGPQLLTWSQELASALGAVHAAGLIYRDFKSNNVLVTPEGRLRIIDFELAYDPDGSLPQYNFGTRGYMSPQHKAWEQANVRDDVYSYGALLYYMATGAEASNAPDDANLLSRPIELLNPAIAPDLSALITRCIHPDREQRFGSMSEVEEALAGMETATVPAPAWGAETPIEPDVVAAGRYRVWARRIGDTLCRTAQPADNGQGLVWPGAQSSDDAITSNDIIQSRHINVGVAGQVLALAELVREFNDHEHRRVLEGGVRWLLSEQRLRGEPISGLYVGEAGVAIALLRAGQALNDPDIIQAASNLGRWVAGLPDSSPCMFVGTAGRLRHHLLLWDETEDPGHLRFAVAAGEQLLALAEPSAGNGLSWQAPNDFGVSAANLGYAHGAAGIGDALIDLYEATGDSKFLEAAAGAARWIAALAVPTTDEGSTGLNWARSERTPLTEGFWCHGAGGIGLFLLRASQFGILEGAFELAHRAALTVGRNVRWAMPIYCHGLAGNIGFLLDMYQATGDSRYWSEARSLGRILGTFATEINGLFVWGSEAPTKFTSVYTVGFSGIATCLLRLSNPERMPQQLSRAGFRYR